MADDADLAVGVVESAKVVGGASDVADQPLVGHSACGAHSGCRVIGIGARRFTRIQVGRDDLVTVDGQPAHELLCLAVVSRHVMYPHDAPAWARCQRHRSVGLDFVTAVACEADRFGSDRIGADRTHCSRPFMVVRAVRLPLT
jgi:hypothetical protein